MACEIYKITSKTTKRIYIGQSQDIGHRWQSHLRQLTAGNHPSPLLQEEYNEHGRTNFAFQLIEETELEKLDEREWHWQNECKSYDPKCGFNSPNEFSRLTQIYEGIIPSQRKPIRSTKPADVVEPVLERFSKSKPLTRNLYIGGQLIEVPISPDDWT